MLKKIDRSNRACNIVIAIVFVLYDVSVFTHKKMYSRCNTVIAILATISSSVFCQCWFRYLLLIYYEMKSKELDPDNRVLLLETDNWDQSSEKKKNWNSWDKCKTVENKMAKK